MDKESLASYAKLLVRYGLNVQKDEYVLVNCAVAAVDLGREVVREAYAAGAKDVNYRIYDDYMNATRLIMGDREVVAQPDDWFVKMRMDNFRKNGSSISIIADDPDALNDVDPELITERGKNFEKRMGRLFSAQMNNSVKWCIACYPELKWAKKMFPDLSDEDAMDKLWLYIRKAMRMDEGDPVENWKKFQERADRICGYLNEKQFDYFEYKSANGTDLTVGMPEGYVFSGGGVPCKSGETFIANMPTEECYSAPHRKKVNGVVYASMPLNDHGATIKDFWVRFKDGKVVDFDAKEGKKTLEEIINTGQGSHYLGEIALVGYDSPIRKLDTIFYDTLFDENASCHFALGRGYSENIRGGVDMSKSELLRRGVNYSIEHCDFMVGTKDLSITAYKDGEAFPIFRDGNFVKEIVG